MGTDGRRPFFYLELWRAPICSACFLPSSSLCLLQSLPAPDLPGLGTRYLLSSELLPLQFIWCIFLVPFCLFFCLECLSLQIFAAERTHSQGIQYKFHLLLGKYTTFVLVSFALFLLLLFIRCSCFVLFLFTFFPFIWREWE